MHHYPYTKFLACLALLISIGCATSKTSNTARTATEQLLISTAVDQSLNRTDFRPFQGHRVFVDEAYLDSVDKKYIVGSLRHRLLKNGASLAKNADEADVVLEVTSGGVGTNTYNSFVGVPEVTVPGMLTLPEVRFAEKSSQRGIAKIGLVAYEPKTRTALGSGGVSLAESEDANWYLFGIGPYNSGSVEAERNRAKRSNSKLPSKPLPMMVSFATPLPKEEPKKLQMASGEEEKPKAIDGIDPAFK